jgi:hypothetical protein
MENITAQGEGVVPLNSELNRVDLEKPHRIMVKVRAMLGAAVVTMISTIDVRKGRELLSLFDRVRGKEKLPGTTLQTVGVVAAHLLGVCWSTEEARKHFSNFDKIEEILLGLPDALLLDLDELLSAMPFGGQEYWGFNRGQNGDSNDHLCLMDAREDLESLRCWILSDEDLAVSEMMCR